MTPEDPPPPGERPDVPAPPPTSGEPRFVPGAPQPPPGEPGFRSGAPSPIDVTGVEEPEIPLAARTPLSGTLRVVLTAVVLLGASVIAATVVADDDLNRSLLVGDCVQPLKIGEVTLTGDELSSSPAKPVDCERSDAAYRVALQAGGAYAACPGPAYQVRRTGIGSSDERTLCMTYNVRTDDCFVETPPNLAGPFDCAEGPRQGAIRVLKVVEGTQNVMECRGLGDQVLVAMVPEPATTYCYVRFDSETPAAPGTRNV